MRVEVRSVGKRYGALTALRDVDLTLESGTRVALIGPNGSGKTTLTRAVLGLIAHDGSVRLDGVAAGIRATQADARIAYVPQVAPQLAAPVGELVRTVATLRGLSVATIAEVTAALGLELASVSKRPFRSLSGGMKQKLLIAMAMAARPRLIVMDEPTASLDAAARARFFALERAMLPGATVLLSSHRLDELRTLVDRVIALDDGRLVHDGAAADYLIAHTHSVIEVLIQGDGERLAARGFTPAAGGWWTRAVDHDEKLRLLPELAGLGDALRDLIVRDHDRVQPEAP